MLRRLWSILATFARDVYDFAFPPFHEPPPPGGFPVETPKKSE
ncbi:MAG TPA: hypothetical protein VGN72_06680 [Tepidisphaeraceae bacterium]|jgi:hypothetical protein|nr:hypothetical protein [Tepidisphaeraceae bacterium]